MDVWPHIYRGIDVCAIANRVFGDAIVDYLLTHCMGIHLIEDWILGEHRGSNFLVASSDSTSGHDSINPRLVRTAVCAI